MIRPIIAPRAISPKVYTGIGSRSTPGVVLNRMIWIGRTFLQAGYVLRSGAAVGADSAFETWVEDPSQKEIYLPWAGFNRTEFCRTKQALPDNGNSSSNYDCSKSNQYFTICSEAIALASRVYNSNRVYNSSVDSIYDRKYPSWDKLSVGAQKLHSRSVYQVLGLDLCTPSEFVVCWTPMGEKIGGTRTAIIIAEMYGVPVYNLALPATCKPLFELLRDISGVERLSDV